MKWPSCWSRSPPVARPGRVCMVNVGGYAARARCRSARGHVSCVGRACCFGLRRREAAAGEPVPTDAKQGDLDSFMRRYTGEIFMFTFVGVLVVLGAMVLFASVKVLPEYQRGVVLTLGRYTGTKGPGLVLLYPVLQRMIKVDLRITVMDVPPQDVISRDNVSVRVNAVVYFRVVQPDKSVLQVVNFFQATSQLAQTRLRSVLGQHELDEILSQRETINRTLQAILDEATDPWGIKVANVEIKDVDLNATMGRAIARTAEPARELLAKATQAEAEMQAAEKLRDRAAMLSQQPQALQLRYLQAMADMSSNGKSSVIVFPLPLDLIKPLMDAFPSKLG